MKNLTITKHLVFVALPLLLGQSLLAQPTQPPAPDKIGLTFSTEATSSGESRLKGGDVTYKHVAISNSSWALSQSIRLDSANSLTLGMAYSLTSIDEGNYKHFERDYSADRVPLPNDLQSLGVSLGCSTKINDQWMLSSSIGTSSNVAKHKLLSKGWGSNGYTMGQYTWSPDLTLAVGFGYDTLSADWKCFPIFGIEWRPAQKWSVAIGFPKTAVTYELDKNLTMALAVSGAGGTYFIENDPRPGTSARSLANSKLEYTEVRFGFETAWKINDTFSLTGAVGSVLYREFKYIDRGYKLRSRDVAPFVSLSFSAAL